MYYINPHHQYVNQCRHSDVQIALTITQKIIHKY